MVFRGHSGSSILDESIYRYSPGIGPSPGYEPLEVYSWNGTAAAQAADAIFARARGEGRFVGFKIRTWSISKQPQLHRALVDKYNLCVIANYRLNKLLRHVTNKREFMLNNSQFAIMKKENDLSKVRLNTSEIVRLYSNVLEDESIEDIIRAARMLANDTDIIHVTYEEFLQRRDFVMQRLLSAMGREAVIPNNNDTHFRKASPVTLAENVDESTFEKLAVLAPAEHHWMLGDQELCE